MPATAGVKAHLCIADLKVRLYIRPQGRLGHRA